MSEWDLPSSRARLRSMGMGEMWSRALVYFGIAEEEEYWDEESFSAEEELERSYAQRPNVRRLPRPQDHLPDAATACGFEDSGQ